MPVNAKKRELVQHAPLPSKVLSAKTIYIQDESGHAEIGDKAYTELKAWGKYQIVDAKEKADLILVLTISQKQMQRDSYDAVNFYNYKTGAWTQGTVPSSSTITWSYTQVRLVDGTSGQIAWADERAWGKKKSATMELLKSLQQRVNEQEKSGTQ